MKNFKSKNGLLIVLVLAITLILSACGGASQNTNNEGKESEDSNQATDPSKPEEQIVLKVADHINKNNLVYQEGIGPWMERVTELTDGKVKFEYYNNGQLGKVTEMYDLVKNKVADIGYILYATDVMPLMETGMLPGTFKNASQAILAYRDFSHGFLLEQSFLPNGVRPVFALASPYDLFTLGPWDNLKDLQGQQIRTGSGLFSVSVKKLGMTPVKMSVAEFLQAAERNALDGTVLPWFAVGGFQMGTVIKYATNGTPLPYFTGNYIMNEEVFQGLPKDVQDAMKQATHELVQHYADAYVKAADDIKETQVKEYGIKVNPLSEEQWNGWKKKLDEVTANWIKQTEDRGFPAQKAYDELTRLAEKYKD